jgi:hypothetical protein
MSTPLSLILASSLTLLMQDDVAEKVREALDHYSYEPSCSEVVGKVLKLARKENKTKIPSTKAMHASALLPVVGLSLAKNLGYDQSLSLLEQDDSTLKIYTNDDFKLKVTLQWDLSSLVFSSAESQVIAKAQVEAKWKLELKKSIVEIYHARKKLQVLLFILAGSVPPETVVEWTLKVEELTSLLDALTADWFSEEIQKRKKKKEQQKSNP